MLKNFFTVAIRTLLRQKTYSLLNLLGLSLGIASILLLSLHVREELSYDSSYPKHDRIYRVVSTEWSKSSPDLAFPMMKAFPEISSIARLTDNGTQVLHTVDDKKAMLKGYFVDSSILDLLDLQRVAGDPFDAMSSLGGIVLTRSAATLLFGKANPIGQRVIYNDRMPFFVKGVIEDQPANTHLQFDYLISMTTFNKLAKLGTASNKSWMFGWTYILLRRPEDIDAVRHRLTAFWTGFRDDLSKTEAADDAAKARLQPITDIHLHSNLIQEMGPNGNILYIYLFIAVAILIGLIACINFVNLFTTQALRRAKEVAVRKVLGAARSQLILQFLGEALLLAIGAGVVALLLCRLALPFYDDLTARHVTVSWFFQPSNLLIITLIVVSTGVLSGLFPALFISALEPANSLKANKTPGSPTSMLRKTLVTFQFVAAGFLIVSTLLVYRQMNLFHERQLGFDKEQVAVVRYYGDLKGKLLSNPDLIRTEFLSNPDILSVGASSNLIGDNLSQEDVEPVHPEAGRKYDNMNVMRVDEHYLDVLRIPLVEGRNFSSEFHDSASFIINESAARAFGLQHPIGTELVNNSVTLKGKIVGVVKDFNFMSLHNTIAPLIMEINPAWNSHLLIRIKAGSTPKTIAWIQDKIASIAPADLFDYGFLDDHVSGLYRKEDNMSTLLRVFSVFSIVISCLGLFGLAAYAAEIRTREIGIRKVIGASTGSLVRLLSVDFMIPVLLGNLLSWPLAGWAVHSWLKEFTYRIDIGWWVFGLSLVLTLLVAMLTIGFRCWQTASANPVESLRSE